MTHRGLGIVLTIALLLLRAVSPLHAHSGCATRRLKLWLCTLANNPRAAAIVSVLALRAGMWDDHWGFLITAVTSCVVFVSHLR